MEPEHIHGHAGRGTGILNNELYVGRLVWDRQRFVKDPDTGNRVARPNPPSAWITTDVPQLRILDDDLWQAAKARQAATRLVVKAGIVRARRPIYLFSGLTKCETCGGGFILSSRDTLRCFNQTARDTCTNSRTITRQEVEGRVLRATARAAPIHGEVFPQKTTELATALEHDEERGGAREALRGFLEKIVIPPGDGLLQVVGNLGEMLAAASGRNGPLVAAVGYGGCGGRI